MVLFKWLHYSCIVLWWDKGQLPCKNQYFCTEGSQSFIFGHIPSQNNNLPQLSKLIQFKIDAESLSIQEKCTISNVKYSGYYYYYYYYPSNHSWMGLKLNLFQKSLESKAHPKSSISQGRARTPISIINLCTHFVWGLHLECSSSSSMAQVQIAESSSAPISSIGFFNIGGLELPHAKARSHQSYTQPSVKIHLWPGALEKLQWMARMAWATSIPWIIWRLA